jgi:hypothetical protein
MSYLTNRKTYPILSSCFAGKIQLRNSDILFGVSEVYYNYSIVDGVQVVLGSPLRNPLPNGRIKI